MNFDSLPIEQQAEYFVSPTALRYHTGQPMPGTNMKVLADWIIRIEELRDRDVISAKTGHLLLKRAMLIADLTALAEACSGVKDAGQRIRMSIANGREIIHAEFVGDAP